MNVQWLAIMATTLLITLAGSAFLALVGEHKGGAVAALVLVGVVISVILVNIQYNTDHLDKLTYNQFYNGVELSTHHETTRCYRDGSCYYTRDCDPYPVTVTYTENGKTKTKPETHYHQCPYAQHETRWWISTTVGDIMVSAHRFDAQNDLYDAFNAIPGYALEAEGVGIPPEIVAAQRALDAHDPRPATTIKTYTDYLKASENTTLKVPQGDIDLWTRQRLLPALATGPYDVDQAAKIHFVGLRVPNPGAWEYALNRLNMEAGSITPPTNRFDIQVVVVDTALVGPARADSYSKALNAYWESAVFSKGALAKNEFVVVFGSDGQTVTWARAFNLIQSAPNGVLFRTIASDLVGVPFDPNTLLGRPTAVLGVDKDGNATATVQATNGKLELLSVLGPLHFQRGHMTSNHPGSTGFGYLESEILPDFWTCVRIGFLAILGGLLAVFIVLCIVGYMTNN